MLLGGEPFDEQIVMWWNFVARDNEEIVIARDEWTAGERFGVVQNAGPDNVGSPLAAPPLPPGTLKPGGSDLAGSLRGGSRLTTLRRLPQLPARTRGSRRRRRPVACTSSAASTSAGTSSRSGSLRFGTNTVFSPARWAASSFCFTPPIGSDFVHSG